jgi:hypothetical protein
VVTTVGLTTMRFILRLKRGEMFFFLYNFMMFVVVINHFSILFIIAYSLHCLNAKQAYLSMFLS